MAKKASAEDTIRKIKRMKRRKFVLEEKIRIVSKDCMVTAASWSCADLASSQS